MDKLFLSSKRFRLLVVLDFLGVNISLVRYKVGGYDICSHQWAQFKILLALEASRAVPSHSLQKRRRLVC